MKPRAVKLREAVWVHIIITKPAFRIKRTLEKLRETDIEIVSVAFLSFHRVMGSTLNSAAPLMGPRLYNTDEVQIFKNVSLNRRLCIYVILCIFAFLCS